MIKKMIKKLPLGENAYENYFAADVRKGRTRVSRTKRHGMCRDYPETNQNQIQTSMRPKGKERWSVHDLSSSHVRERDTWYTEHPRKVFHLKHDTQTPCRQRLRKP